MSDTARVHKLPPCDFHNKEHEAIYDFRTRQGVWGNGCQEAFDRFGLALGTGYGQRLVVNNAN